MVEETMILFHKNMKWTQKKTVNFKFVQTCQISLLVLSPTANTACSPKK